MGKQLFIYIGPHIKRPTRREDSRIENAMLNDDLETRDWRHTAKLQAVTAQLERETARRVRAEEELQQVQADWGQEHADLIHELQSHHFVLETQNEALRRVQTKLEMVRDRYVDLHDYNAIIVHREGEIIFANLAAAELFGAPRTEQLLGKSVWDLVQPDYRQIVAVQSQHLIAPDIVPTLEQKIFRGDGIVLDVAILSIPINYLGRPAVQLIARDITVRKQREEALEAAKNIAERARSQEKERRQAGERRQRIAEGLRDILTVLNSNQSLEEVLAYITRQAGQLFNNQAAALYRLENEGDTLSLQAAHGLPPGFALTATIPFGPNDLGPALSLGRVVSVPDVATILSGESDWLETEPAALVALWSEHYRALLAIPIVVRERIYGGLVLYYVEPQAFSPDEIELAGVFSSQIALAIDNARLRNQIERVAISAERDRLARDLHDAVTQILFSASLIAEVLPELWDTNPAEARHSLEKLRLLTRGALAEMRTLFLELRPAVLTERPLSISLYQLSEAFTGQSGLPVDLIVTEKQRLPPEVQVALYRIAQEALTNISRHAQASQVTLILRGQGDRIELGIRDNGRGFDPKAIPPDHQGVAIMHERVERIGAVLSLTSEPDQGTQVTVVWNSDEGRRTDE